MKRCAFIILRNIRTVAAIAICVILCAMTVNAGMPEYRLASADSFPSVSPGTSKRLIVKSECLDDEMTVDVWFPPSYNFSVPGGFPVIYAYDGQNLFDPALSFANVAWELDKTAGTLAEKGEIAAPIIVGIHNRGGKNFRPNDYFPEKAISYIPDSDKDSSLIWQTCAAGFYGDEHAAFTATELKPLIDYLYNTNYDRDHTFVMGSSMGALASLYLLCEYPDIFGGAACLSTHWIGSLVMNHDYTLQDDPVCARAIIDYMDEMLPEAAHRKLYLDQGSTEWDADYLAYESEARGIARNHGYSENDATLMTFNATGSGHNEWYWQQRADRPLKFLLGNLSSGIMEIKDSVPERTAPIYDLSGRIVKSSTPAYGIYIHAGKKILKTSSAPAK